MKRIGVDWVTNRLAVEFAVSGVSAFGEDEQGRIYHANYSEDLQVAEQLLGHWPAYPLWNMWAPFDDIGAAVNLDRFLRSINSIATVIPARLRNNGSPLNETCSMNRKGSSDSADVMRMAPGVSV